MRRPSFCFGMQSLDWFGMHSLEWGFGGRSWAYRLLDLLAGALRKVHGVELERLRLVLISQCPSSFTIQRRYREHF